MANIVIIGAGIHGLTTAISLSEDDHNIILIDKNSDILQGTSGSTHNRAHIGYHYPRSKETARECFDGLQYFKQKYEDALFYPKDVYYIIEKNSKVSMHSFKTFCDEMRYPYEITLPQDKFLIKKNIEGGFKVKEPIFHLPRLKKQFKQHVKQQKINVFTSTILTDFNKLKDGYELICYNNGLKTHFNADIIINATYAYCNNILKILDLEEDMSEYRLQHTEVAVLKTKQPVPSLTIMDGPFLSLMPYANYLYKNFYLLYDVVHSVIDEERGYFFYEKSLNSNINKMLEKCSQYFPFDLTYISSLYGSRPIPIKNSENIGDCRKTRIKCHQKYPNIYSILEGKFISAPLIAKNIKDLLR